MKLLRDMDRAVAKLPCLALLACVVLGAVTAAAQGGNTISGYVFGTDRRPLADINMELLDEYSRTISRQRTNSAGRYLFVGVPNGRLKVRVLPLGTNYEQEEQEVEIVNIMRPSGTSGNQVRVAGAANEQKDFYLRPRRNTTGLSAPATIFVQEVPENARQLYKAGVEHLEHNRTQEAYGSLKAAIEVFPRYFVALETLGIEYVKAGHFEAAAVLLQVALQVNPKAYKCWYGLARAFVAQKNPAEALTAAEKAVELNGSAPESLFLAGSLLRQSKEYSKAERHLLKASELAGDAIPDVHWELALLYANGQKRYKDAAKELRLYLKAVPDHKDAERIKKLIADFEEKARAAA